MDPEFTEGDDDGSELKTYDCQQQVAPI